MIRLQGKGFPLGTGKVQKGREGMKRSRCAKSVRTRYTLFESVLLRETCGKRQFTEFSCSGARAPPLKVVREPQQILLEDVQNTPFHQCEQLRNIRKL